MLVFTSEGGILIGNGELFVIHELRHEGLSISAIARHTGLARKTVRKYLDQGLQAPRYGPWAPRPVRLLAGSGHRWGVATVDGGLGRHREPAQRDKVGSRRGRQRDCGSE